VFESVEFARSRKKGQKGGSMITGRMIFQPATWVNRKMPVCPRQTEERPSAEQYLPYNEADRSLSMKGRACGPAFAGPSQGCTKAFKPLVAGRQSDHAWPWLAQSWGGLKGPDLVESCSPCQDH
jgi:hypothetical protein